jgi:hypothetical protein
METRANIEQIPVLTPTTDVAEQIEPALSPETDPSPSEPEPALNPETEPPPSAPDATEVPPTTIPTIVEPEGGVESEVASPLDPEQPTMIPVPDNNPVTDPPLATADPPPPPPPSDPLRPSESEVIALSDSEIIESLASSTIADKHTPAPSEGSGGSPTSSKFPTTGLKSKRRSILGKIRHLFDKDESDRSTEGSLSPRTSLNLNRERKGSLRRRSKIIEH